MSKKVILGILILLLAGLIILISMVVGAAVANKLVSKDNKYDLIAAYYATENAVMVSPHGLRKSMDKGEVPYTIVDLRSAQEYEKEHIIGAINIPAYSDPDTSAYDQVNRIVGEFKKLPSNKDIVVYCYSIPCMTGRKVGQMLVEHGIFVKHLGIGWNEWRHHWNLWNHEHEWEQTNVEDYIVSGKEPGHPKKNENPLLTPCNVDNTFGC